MPVIVLLRFSQKTGKIDTTITSLSSAMLSLWALQHTTRTKASLIVERDTGRVINIYEGTVSGFPSRKEGHLGTIEDYGISLENLKQIKDDRFDKETEK